MSWLCCSTRLLKDGREVFSILGSIENGLFSSFRVKEAAHRIEHAEVESENVHEKSPWV